MKIAIDISPIKSGNYKQHVVRGSGFYLNNLKEALQKYHKENEYLFIDGFRNAPNDIDLLHIPYFEPFFLTLPKRKKHKTIVTVHDLTPIVFSDKFPSGIKGGLKWKVQKNLLNNMDAIITDSYSSKEDIQKYAGIDVKKINVVSLAAAEHFTKLKGEGEKLKVKKKYKLPDEFLLYVGDVTWNKNLSTLIKAVIKTDQKLVIVGKAFDNIEYDKTNLWNRELFEAQVLSKGIEKIKALGFVEDEDLVKLYNSATAFIMPSHYEGFGLPILEAMQSGCPVITTRAGSLEEVADSAAYFVDPNDLKSIENGINEVMSKRELRDALSKKGLEQAKKFSWKKTADETNELYRKVVVE